MAGTDIYRLGNSDKFYLGPGKEASADLVIEKDQPFPCAALFGKVVSGSKPVSGATVKLLGRNHVPLRHTDTDGAGRFSFDCALPPGRFEIIAAADGYSVSESRFIFLEPFSRLSVTVRLRPDESSVTAAVYGVVRDGMNKPLPGAAVRVFRHGASDDPSAAALTDAEGEYLVHGLAPGEYGVSCFLAGYYLPAVRELSLSAKDIACADMYLYRDEKAPGGTASGKVVFNGVAVPNALTALYFVENNGSRLICVRRANSRGLYLFRGLKPGFYIVRAETEEGFLNTCFKID